MSDHKGDIQMDSGVVIEVKSDMRDRLVANLRSQARQSSVARKARAAKYAHKSLERATVGSASRAGTVSDRVSIVEGEPQSVLIKNRNEDLAKDVIRLRNKYAKLLTEEADK